MANCIPSARTRPRVLADLGPSDARPDIVAIGSLHGDEPAGSTAIVRFAQKLEARSLKGRFVGLTGNVQALAKGVRYVDQDLNRIFPPIEPTPSSAETRERNELMALLEQLKPKVVLDLHTTSGDGPPFGLIDSRPVSLQFALRFPFLKIRGLDRYIRGMLLSYAKDLGAITLGYEAGQHADPESIARHEALLWLSAQRAGLLPFENDLEAHRRTLTPSNMKSSPDLLDVIFRYGIQPDETFEMRPGYTHFQPVAEKEHLATSSLGAVYSPKAGFLLMPRYTDQGDDGFFLAQPSK